MITWNCWGLLNSSIACFWLKQVCHNKGGGGIGGGLATELWEQFYDLNATPINAFPVPSQRPLHLTQSLEAEAEAFSAELPERILAAECPDTRRLQDAHERAQAHLFRMISLQEELDWRVYHLYGLLDEDLSLPPDEVPPLRLGDRPFEIIMARQMAAGELETTWFDRHNSEPITELPRAWSDRYREVVQRRLQMIETNRDVALIEQPEYKRRWNLPSWEELEQAALKNWLLGRMEASDIWHEHTLVSCSQLRDVLARDASWLGAAEIYNRGPLENLDDVVIRLVIAESVPFLPVLRYTETGRQKREEWERVWVLQRREDAGETVEIPVPAKYRAADFQRPDYWRLRGALDIPNERFIRYPSLERDADVSPVIGWAGWSHLDQARAIASYYQQMRTQEGWEPERLKPILAGLLDLKPWLTQWYNDLDPESGVRLGEYFVQFAESQCQELGFSPEEIQAWQPIRTASQNRRNRRPRRFSMSPAVNNVPKLRDLFDLPKRVNPGDFVLKLSEVVDHPDQALKDYVVTDQLARCFDDALGLVQSALASRESKATYLHGSFGAGKSHFMAVLYLLLQGNAGARSLDKLAPMVTKHNEWTQGKKFLLVPYHMIGADSVEQRLLGGYYDLVTKLHPDRPPAGLFPSDSLIENARTLRAQMGDETFFQALNSSASGDWGAMEGDWDAAVFERCSLAGGGSADGRV